MDNSPSATRRPKQARAIRTRERILEHAERAFAEKGFEAASLTSDILEPAGISVGSFYHQFGDKGALLHSLLEERDPWDELTGALAATSGQPTLADTVRVGLVVLLDDIDRHPATWSIHFRELCSADAGVRALIARSWQTWEGAVSSMLVAGTDDGRHRAGRLLYATAGLTGVLRRYLDGDVELRRTIREEMLDDVVAACVDAVGA